MLTPVYSWTCAWELSRFSRVQLCATPWTVAHQVLCPWDSPRKNTGVGCHPLLQGTFPIQGLSRGLIHLLRWQAGSLPRASPEKPWLMPKISLKWVRVGTITQVCKIPKVWPCTPQCWLGQQRNLERKRWINLNFTKHHNGNKQQVVNQKKSVVFFLRTV